MRAVAANNRSENTHKLQADICWRGARSPIRRRRALGRTAWIEMIWSVPTECPEKLHREPEARVRERLQTLSILQLYGSWI